MSMPKPDKKKKKLIGYGCPECKNLHILHDFIHDESYCSRCGLVLMAPRTPDTVVRGLRPVFKYVTIMEK